MAKKKQWKFDAAGWLFWIIVFVALLAPSIYGVRQIVWEDAQITVWLGLGIICAAIGAGFISWAVNAVIQHRRKKQRLIERKKAKKQR